MNVSDLICCGCSCIYGMHCECSVYAYRQGNTAVMTAVHVYVYQCLDVHLHEMSLICFYIQCLKLALIFPECVCAHACMVVCIAWACPPSYACRCVWTLLKYVPKQSWLFFVCMCVHVAVYVSLNSCAVCFLYVYTCIRGFACECTYMHTIRILLCALKCLCTRR